MKDSPPPPINLQPTSVSPAAAMGASLPPKEANLFKLIVVSSDFCFFFFLVFLFDLLGIGSSIQANLVFWHGIVRERLSFMGARFTVFVWLWLIGVGEWLLLLLVQVDGRLGSFVLDWWG